jgi:hypothetical protein
LAIVDQICIEPNGTSVDEFKEDNGSEAVKSDNSSVGSSDSGDSPKRSVIRLAKNTDDDEEYSNLYRKAKKAHHQKLIQKNTIEEETTDQTKDYTVELSQEKEFFHYLAVPVLRKENEAVRRDGYYNQEETSDHYLGYKKEKGEESVEYMPNERTSRINYKKSYKSMSIVKSSIIENRYKDSSSDDEETKVNDKRIASEKMNFLFDPTTQKASIGETLFDTTNLKGCQKLSYVFMFIIECLRFICFRNKRPRGKTQFFMFPFIIVVLFDALITINLILHMRAYSSNEKVFTQIGLWYFLLYPGVAVLSPLVGIIAQILCRSYCFKFYVVVSSLSCLFNLPLTFIFQIVYEDKFYYIMEVLITITLRVFLCNLANFQIAMIEHSKSLAVTKTRSIN